MLNWDINLSTIVGQLRCWLDKLEQVKTRDDLNRLLKEAVTLLSKLKYRLKGIDFES